MSVVDQIEQLKGYPQEASEAFRAQLERARASREAMDGRIAPVKGIDRSGSLTPMTRPTLVRSVFTMGIEAYWDDEELHAKPH